MENFGILYGSIGKDTDTYKDTDIDEGSGGVGAIIGVKVTVIEYRWTNGVGGGVGGVGIGVEDYFTNLLFPNNSHPTFWLDRFIQE